MLYSYIWVIPRRLNFVCQRFSSIFKAVVSRSTLTYTAYEDGTECSETSACKIETPGNHPKVRIQKNILLADINQVTLNCFPLATGWTVRSSNPGGCKILSVLQACPDPTWGAPGDIYNMSWVFFPIQGVDHPRPSSAKIEREWRYTFTPPLCILWRVME